MLNNTLTIDEDLALGRLKDPEEGTDERRLPCAGATNNADFLAMLDVNADIFEYQIEFFSISCAKILEGNISL